MKSAPAQRISVAVAACAAAALFSTGTATADSTAAEPVSDYGSAADLTTLLTQPPGSSAVNALNAGSSAIGTGSGLGRLASQFICQLEGGKWDPAAAYCKFGGFQPGSLTIDIAATATPIDSGSSGSSSGSGMLGKINCQLLIHGTWNAATQECGPYDPHIVG